MVGPARKTLRVTGNTILVISIVAQVLSITTSFIEFDPRHGRSDLYVVLAGIAVFGWIAGGVAGILGRFSPPYVSAIVPAGMGTLTVLFVVDLARHANYNVPTLARSLAFTLDVCVFAFLVAGPAFGVWFLGFHTRALRRSIRALTR
jgi:hypothetical protein